MTCRSAADPAPGAATVVSGAAGTGAAAAAGGGGRGVAAAAGGTVGPVNNNNDACESFVLQLNRLLAASLVFGRLDMPRGHRTAVTVVEI